MAREGTGTMDKKRIRLPREGLVEPEQGSMGGPGPTDTEDVEGHGLPITAPPTGAVPHGPGHGGEAIPNDDDDVEGHKR
jgi:hypothetical protein